MININFISGVALFFYCAFLLVAIFNRKYLIPELFLMLLPYWLILNLIILGLIFFFNQKIFTKLSFFNLSNFVLLVITLSLLTNFIKFNFFSLPEVQANSQNEVKLAFFNKLYSNTNYSEINSHLNLINPSIIGFSEFKREDLKNINYLDQYKYSILKDSRDNSTIAFFSNLPFEEDVDLNLPFVLPLKIKLNNEEYRAFIIHPVPPANSAWLENRNKEIVELSNYIKSLNTERVIIMGDFNLTPWSLTYKDFANDLNSLKNVSLGRGANFTWGNKFIKTQVDHIFVPKSWIVENFKVEYVKGSDHRLIWAKASF